jgi:hypothetical protein
MNMLLKLAGILISGFLSAILLGDAAIAAPPVSVLEREMLVALSDAHPDQSYKLKFELDSSNGRLNAFKFETPSGPVPFGLGDIGSGVAIYKDKFLGKDLTVINIQGVSFDSYRGGGMRLAYLANAITGEWREFEFEVIRGAGNDWELYSNDSSGRAPFRYMCLKSNKVFRRAIGIKDVIVNAYLQSVQSACE